MEKKYNFRFDSETGILYKNYFGAVKLDDIFSSWDNAIKDKLIPKETKGFILDYREAYFDMEIAAHKEIPDYYRKNIEVFRNQKIAIVTQSPENVVIPILVAFKDNGYISRPFYSIESAEQWILLGQPSIETLEE